MNKIYKSNKDVFIAGVCAGIGEAFNIDATIIRIIFVVFGIYGPGILLYILLWIVLPSRNERIENNAENNTNFSQNDANFSQNNSSENTEKNNVYEMKKEGDSYTVKRTNKSRTIFAVILIVLGCVLIVNNHFGILNIVLDIFDLRIYWPAIFIIFGLILLFTGKKSIKSDKNDQKK